MPIDYIIKCRSGFFAIVNDMHIFARIIQMFRWNRWQAPENHDNCFGIIPAGFPDAMSALGRRCVGNTAGVNQHQSCPTRRSRAESSSFEKLPNLLALILVNFAAECMYGKCSHNLI